MSAISNVTTTAQLWVETLDLGKIPAAGWDDLAQRCDGSDRCAHAHLKRLWLRFLGLAVPKTYGVYSGPRDSAELIGHFTIVDRHGYRQFYNGISLLPAFEPQRLEVFQRALNLLGPGDYEYGWSLSLEPSREAEFRCVSGVDIRHVQNVLVHAVDFSRWPDWEKYYRDISENSRRNAKKAEQAHPDMQIVVRKGFAALGALPNLLRLRTSLYRRKNLSFDSARVFLGYVGRILVCPAETTVAWAAAGATAETLAVYHGVEFGQYSYYLDGAAALGAEGGAWSLLITMLRRAYDRTPTGKFIMGYMVVPPTKVVPEGLMRSRRAVRVNEYPTGIVQFRWAPELQG